MTSTSPLGPLTALAGPPAPAPTIRSVQPDRDHGVLEMAGALGHDNAAECRQRVEGLLVAGTFEAVIAATRDPSFGFLDALSVAAWGRKA